MKNKTIDFILNKKLIVIVRGVEESKILPLAEAMYNGGIRLMEFTYSADGSVTDEKNAEIINSVVERFGDDMIFGAGTVLTPKQVELTKQAGGKFIISPDCYEDVIKKTVELDMVSMPGALTPSEIQTAHRAGADFVKLFPTVSLGVEYIKAIKAPLSHIRFTAVGGINENNIKEYLDAGVSGFGIGTNIVNKKMISENDFDGITRLAKAYVDALRG